MRIKYNLIDGGKVSIESNNVTQFTAIDIDSTRIFHLENECEIFHDVHHPLDTVASAIFRTSLGSDKCPPTH